MAEKTIDDLNECVALIFGVCIGYAKSKGVSLEMLQKNLADVFRKADCPLSRMQLFSKLLG